VLAVAISQASGFWEDCQVQVGGTKFSMSLSPGGVLVGFGKVFDIVPALCSVWDSETLYHQSATDAPHVVDVMVFLGKLVFLKKACRRMFRNVFIPVLKELIQYLAIHVEKGIWAAHCEFGSSPLPPLLGNSGKKRRRADPSSLMMASKRIRAAGQIHEGPVCAANVDSCSARVASSQSKIRSCLLLEKADLLYSGQQHFSFAWDPGLHSTQSTMALVGYCPDIDVAGYGPVANIRNVPLAHYDSEEVLTYVETGARLERKVALAEMCTVEHVLNTGFGGCSLTDTKPWEGDCIRPLRAGEVRRQIPGEQGYIIESAAGSLIEETPEEHVADQGTQVHVTDQGSTGAAALFYLIYCLGYVMQVFPDPNHRVWNDVKGAAQHCKSFLWRTIVQFVHVFNLNYGPFGKGNHFDEKKQFWEDWKANADIDDPFFRKYAKWIAQDMRLPEPSSVAEFEQLLAQVKKIKCCDDKGPLVKLMRWFSWWASARWYDGELVVLKMILEAYLVTVMDKDPEDIMRIGKQDADAIPEVQPDEPAVQTAKAAKAELNQLKKEAGNWKCAFHCITPQNIAQMHILLVGVRPVWNANTARVRGVKNAQQSLQYEIDMAKGAWQDEIVAILAVLDDAEQLEAAGASVDPFDPDQECAASNLDALQERICF